MLADRRLSGCKTELFGKVEEADANAVLTVLYGEGIAATKVAEGDAWRIEVDEKDQQRALRATRNHGVPRERFATMGDLFKKEASARAGRVREARRRAGRTCHPAWAPTWTWLF